MLVDWADGGTAYELDGTVRKPHVSYAYAFDACATSPDGRYAVIYKRLGTKGLLLKDGEFLRELNRSYYFADAYEYPVCLWHTPSGQTLLAHCPDEYNSITIEGADTGEAIASWQGAPRDAADFFHSRLQASPSGKRLLSAGWVWHPLDAVVYFDVAFAFEHPSHLGSGESTAESCHVGLAAVGSAAWEVGSAAWQTDDRIILTGTEEPEEVAESWDELDLRPCGLAVYDISSRQTVSSAVLDRPAGTVMPVGPDHVIAFYQHPRLVRLADGKVLHEWPELATGEQASSIIHHIDKPPPLALDPTGRRFAVATTDCIRVVSLDLPAEADH